MKAYGLFCAAVAASLLAGCGSPSDSVTFQPPASFHQKASFGPFMQMWEAAPRNDLMLLAFPVRMDLNKALEQSNVKDAKVEKSGHTAICDGQDAVYATLRGTMTTAGNRSTTPSQIEVLVTNVKGKTYMAMYLRPFHEKADPAAQRAIKNVCAK